MTYMLGGHLDPFMTSIIKLARLLEQIAAALDLDVFESHNRLKAEPQPDGTKEAAYRMTFALRPKKPKKTYEPKAQ